MLVKGAKNERVQMGTKSTTGVQIGSGGEDGEDDTDTLMSADQYTIYQHNRRDV